MLRQRYFHAFSCSSPECLSALTCIILLSATSEAGAGPSLQGTQQPQPSHAAPQMVASQAGAVHPGQGAVHPAQGQIMQNQSGQFVFVNHPTLGNVGQMVGNFKVKFCTKLLFCAQ